MLFLFRKINYARRKSRFPFPTPPLLFRDGGVDFAARVSARRRLRSETAAASPRSTSAPPRRAGSESVSRLANVFRRRSPRRRVRPTRKASAASPPPRDGTLRWAPRRRGGGVSPSPPPRSRGSGPDIHRPPRVGPPREERSWRGRRHHRRSRRRVSSGVRETHPRGSRASRRAVWPGGAVDEAVPPRKVRERGHSEGAQRARRSVCTRASQIRRERPPAGPAPRPAFGTRPRPKRIRAVASSVATRASRVPPCEALTTSPSSPSRGAPSPSSAGGGPSVVGTRAAPLGGVTSGKREPSRAEGRPSVSMWAAERGATTGTRRPTRVARQRAAAPRVSEKVRGVAVE